MKGLCSVCGKGGPLTFEHVPPKAAMNVPGAIQHTFDEWLAQSETGDLPGGYIQPKGMGFTALCKKCNELGGTLYVPAYAEFVHQGHQLLAHLPAPQVADQDPKYAVVECQLKKVRAGAVIRQAVTMLLAANPPVFSEQHPELRQLVLDPKPRVLTPRYALYLLLFRGPIMRYVGVSVKWNIETKQVTQLTEVAYVPFAWTLTVDSEPFLPDGDVTEWSQIPAEQSVTIKGNIIVGFGHTPYPGDYRSSAAMKAEGALSLLDKQASANKGIEE